MKVFLFLAAILIAAAGALWSGVYNISALDPHWDSTLQVIAIARDRSIMAHSENVKIPSLDDPKLAPKGAPEYHEMCRVCHGAPGIPAEAFAQGLYPSPADLLSGQLQKRWKENQLFWIITNGLKMTGMPAFGVTSKKDDLLAITAFLGRLPGMTPEQYKAITGATGESDDKGVHAGHSHRHGGRNSNGASTM